MGKLIFVASSKEARTKAQIIVDALNSAGFSPLPWWDEQNAFRFGDYTFDRLGQLSRTVDAAIFLATKDDRIWYRGTESGAPRDNVILELGLFASQLGIKRSLILADSEIKLPSDLLGLTYAEIKGIDIVAANAVTHLRAVFALPPPTSPTLIISDRDLVPVLAGDPPSGWLMRSFYFGTAGARAWRSVSGDLNYQDDPERSPLKSTITSLLSSTPSVRTFVSLGPGDGRLDEGLAVFLRTLERELNYVPVDISDGLLFNAARKISSRVAVPIGILADFEERFDFVVGNLRDFVRGPYLYALLGNTFGNLDRSESQFIQGLWNHLDPNDEVIIDVAIQKKDNAVIDVRDLSAGNIEFLSHGAACHLGVPASEIKANFYERVGFDLVKNGSEIPNTQTFRFFAREGARRRTCARIRRFHYESLINWLKERRWHIRAEKIEEQGPYDTAVLLLKRQQ